MHVCPAFIFFNIKEKSLCYGEIVNAVNVTLIENTFFLCMQFLPGSIWRKLWCHQQPDQEKTLITLWDGDQWMWVSARPNNKESDIVTACAVMLCYWCFGENSLNYCEKSSSNNQPSQSFCCMWLIHRGQWYSVWCELWSISNDFDFFSFFFVVE